jgi:colanic acid biosynthesis protein WcaH
MTHRLTPERFAEVVKYSPLVSIDLIVRNPAGLVLLGFRTNEPAKDYWFVPGGRICKDERMGEAFARITGEELGVVSDLDQARVKGVYEHLYDKNFAEQPGFGTHYVVLAHEIELDLKIEDLPPDQHSQYRWFTISELLAATDVHTNAKAYFKAV